MLQRLGECLHVPREAAEIHQVLNALEDSTESQGTDDLGLLALAGRQLELRLASSQLTSRDAWALVADGFPVLLLLEDGDWLLLKQKVAWRLEAMFFKADDRAGKSELLQLSLSQLKRYWQGQKRLGALLAQGTKQAYRPALVRAAGAIRLGIPIITAVPSMETADMATRMVMLRSAPCDAYGECSDWSRAT